MEAQPDAAAAWVAHVNARSQETLYPRAASFYVGAEVEGKPRVFMPYAGGVRQYRRILERTAAADYAGFVFRDGADDQMLTPSRPAESSWVQAAPTLATTQEEAA